MIQPSLFLRRAIQADAIVTGEIQLAEMTALPPFAQVIADMGGLGSFRSSRGGVCIHGGKPTMRIFCIPLPLT